MMVPAILLFLFFTTFFSETAAQTTTTVQPFETSVLGFEVTAGISKTMFNDYWEPGPGFNIFWTTPFYLGDLEIRAGYRQAHSSLPDIPDLVAIPITAGWSLPINLTDRVSLSAGVRIGNNFVYRRSAGPLNGPESEFTAGWMGSIRFQAMNSLSLRAGVQQTRIYTFHRINRTTAGLGLQYHFTTPKSLVRFLQ